MRLGRGPGALAPSELLCTGPQVCTPDHGDHGRGKLRPGLLPSWWLGPRSSWLVPQTAGQGGAGGGRGPWETRWDHSSQQKKFGGEEARAELSLFLSSPTFLSAAPPCNGGGGGGRLSVAVASVQGSCAAMVCVPEAPGRAEHHSASEVRARLGSQRACGTTCKQSSPSLLKKNAKSPPPSSVGLDASPAGSIRCSVDARKVGLRKKPEHGANARLCP